MRPIARRFQNRPQRRHGRSLAVGSGHMDHRRQALLGVAQTLQQTQHAPQRKIDDLGMQTRQAVKNAVDHHASSSST